MTGLNGVAATLATGVIPQEHGLVGQREPDPISREVRAVDGRSWQHEPFWSLLASKGRSSCTIGWPATEPVHVLVNEESTNSILVAPHGFAPREDPQEAWLLPPKTVSPDELRPIVRSCRVHPGEVRENKRAYVTLKSIASIASALLARDNPDLLACWLSPSPPEDPEQASRLLTDIDHSIRLMVESAGECSLAILCLPGVREVESTLTEPLQGELFLDSPRRDLESIPPVVQDVELTPLVLRMLGEEFQPSRIDRPDPDQVASAADKRAHELIQSGRRPRRSHGRQRIYTRMSGQRSGVIGADLLARQDFVQARRWLEEGVRTRGHGSFVGLLVRSLLGAGDKDRLDRLAHTSAITPFMRTIAASASALLRGEKEMAIQALGDDPPANHAHALLRAEMLLRAGDAAAASDLFKRCQDRIIRTGNIRALRLSFIAARRSGRGPLVADLAKALVRARPLSVRRRRFFERD
jgi:hypothetical protein